MNNERRKELTEVNAIIHQQEEQLRAIEQAEREAFENMPENMQEGERGQKMEENADEMDSVASELEELRNRIDEIINQ